jgi:hypothetical protein
VGRTNRFDAEIRIDHYFSLIISFLGLSTFEGSYQDLQLSLDDIGRDFHNPRVLSRQVWRMDNVKFVHGSRTLAFSDNIVNLFYHIQSSYLSFIPFPSRTRLSYQILIRSLRLRATRDYYRR